MVGGSTARSSTAPYDKTIVAYLERELNSRFKTNVIEVINAGMSGYVVEQEFIFIQMLLYKYEPDMIVGLDGYNDLMSFKLNRHFNSQILYPPQNWRDFLVISQGKEKIKFHYRLKALFKNIFRAADFINRIIHKQNQYDYSNINEEILDKYKEGYWRIVNDIYDFCSAKKIKYYNFLQPVKYYLPNNKTNYVREGGIETLGKLYRKYDIETIKIPYAFSLTDILESHLDVYTDAVHVSTDGNIVFAKAMANYLEKKLISEIQLKEEDIDK